MQDEMVNKTQEDGDDGLQDGHQENEDSFEALRLKAKRALAKKEAKKTPKIIMADQGIKARLYEKQDGQLIPRSSDSVKPVDLFDLQSMIIACIVSPAHYSTQTLMCQVLRSQNADKVAVFVLQEGVDFEVSDFEVGSLFKEVIAFEKSEHLVDRLTLVPLTSGQNRKLHQQEKDMFEKSIDFLNKDYDDPISRSDLIMTHEQMVEHGYPSTADPKFIPSLETYGKVTDLSPLFSLDCEMCLTKDQEYEVTRIILMNEDEEVVLDKFCLTTKPIIDYKTQFSGITAKDLKGITTTIQDIRGMIRKLLPSDAILVGQSLESDLKALGISHPFVIDTSVIFNLSGNRMMKTSLKNLARKFLGIDIQTDSVHGHCPKEDALASLNLVKLKMRKGLKFGDVILCPHKKNQWMKGIAHFMPIASFVEKKKESGFKVFYDFTDFDSVSKSMVILSRHNSKSKVKETVTNFISSSTIKSLKMFCIVVCFDGRCYIAF